MMKPWIGSNYERPENFKNRTLILGESSYGASERFNQNRTIECVEVHLGDNSDTNFSRFAVKIKKTVFGQKTKLSNKEFWRDVAGRWASNPVRQYCPSLQLWLPVCGLGAACARIVVLDSPNKPFFDRVQLFVALWLEAAFSTSPNSGLLGCSVRTLS